MKLLHGDCLDLMSDILDGSVDMVMADPPYGTTACKWDSVIPLEPMWEHLKRVIKKNGAIVMTASQPFTTTLISSNMKMFKYEWIWGKNRPTNFFNAYKMPLKLHENILVFYKKQPTYNPIKEDRTQSSLERLKYKHKVVGNNSTQVYGISERTYESLDKNKRLATSFQRIPMSHRESGLHPTQKPVALMEYLIKTYTNEGETVLDFCMGSGTTGVACLNLNRRFIGIEKDPDYFKIASERIDRAQEQPGLFN